jgi:hypothetical protein
LTPGVAFCYIPERRTLNIHTIFDSTNGSAGFENFARGHDSRRFVLRGELKAVFLSAAGILSHFWKQAFGGGRRRTFTSVSQRGEASEEDR